MHEKCCFEFQAAVDENLIRHRSIIDIITKYQESAARVNRAVAKAVTECGCIKVTAARPEIPADSQYSDIKNYVSSHTSGELCEKCRETVAKELGTSLFYMAALSNLTGLKLHDVMREELKNVTTLGVYHLS